MNLIREVANANFDTAWKYVCDNYAYLFHPSLRMVSLLHDRNHAPYANGLHIRNGNVSTITVRGNAMFTDAYFVEVIVHELTHLQQYSSGRAWTMTTAQLEGEAYPAGRNARYLYEFHKTQADLATLAVERQMAAFRR